jgi:ligand-binding SRPBCC domain-containing protein
MQKIVQHTTIHAPAARCFDLARSIDLHLLTSAHTHEKAIAGRVSGLIGLDEEVTWRAKHLGFYFTLTSQITEFEYPKFFTDKMTKGIFKHLKHNHFFDDKGNLTIMTDIFQFQSPMGLAGKLFDKFFLKKYLQNFIAKRNRVIKEYAESDKWKMLLEK